MKIKKDCSNCNYYSEEGQCTRSKVCEFRTFEYWEPQKPFDRYDITNMTIDPCPLVDWCPSKTAPCNVMPPDEGCYWYRYFRDLIEKAES